MKINKKDVTIVAQGRFDANLLHLLASSYAEYAEFVYSTWENEELGLDTEQYPDIQFVVNRQPELKPGATQITGDIVSVSHSYLQVTSTLKGLEKVKTEFCVKLRTDEYYTDLSHAIDCLSSGPDKLWTSNIFFRPPMVYNWHISDHVMIAKTSDLIKTFKLAKQILENRGFLPDEFLPRVKDDMWSYARGNDQSVDSKKLRTPIEGECFSNYQIRAPECVSGVSYLLACRPDIIVDQEKAWDIMYQNFGVFDVNLLGKIEWTCRPWEDEDASCKERHRYHRYEPECAGNYGQFIMNQDDFLRQKQHADNAAKAFANKSTKIKIYITTYKNNNLLTRCIENLLASDVVDFDYEINVLNNHNTLSIEHPRIKVLDNEGRPDFSTGHLSRNWNQALINGFVDLENPDCDIVVTMQNDIVVRKNWVRSILSYHVKYDFLSFGAGDGLCSYTVDAVKNVGLWDERFCNIGYQEADYFLRQYLYNVGKASINDHEHIRLINPVIDPAFDSHIDYKMKSLGVVDDSYECGFVRKDENHLASMEHHDISLDFFRKKWYSSHFEVLPAGNLKDYHKKNYLWHNKWSKKRKAEDLLGIDCVECQSPQPIVYPYFEKSIPNLSEKAYDNYAFQIDTVDVNCIESSKQLDIAGKVYGNYSESARDAMEAQGKLWPELDFFKTGPQHSYLDIGCMDGHRILSIAAPMFGSVHGCDASDLNIEDARKRLMKLTESPKRVFTKIEDLSLSCYVDNEFDNVQLGHYFQCITSRTQRKKFITHIHRVMKEEGYIFIKLGFGDLKSGHLLEPYSSEKIIENMFKVQYLDQVAADFRSVGFKKFVAFVEPAPEHSVFHSWCFFRAQKLDKI